MRHLRSICVLLLAAAFVAGSAFGQAVSATIVGTVTDLSGAVVANAKVTLTETNTGVDRGRGDQLQRQLHVPQFAARRL